MLISDCSKPLPLIGVLAGWFVNDGDNTLGLIGLPDRVNVFGLDVLGLEGRLTVIGLLLGFSSGFVVVVDKPISKYSNKRKRLRTIRY